MKNIILLLLSQYLKENIVPCAISTDIQKRVGWMSDVIPITLDRTLRPTYPSWVNNFLVKKIDVKNESFIPIRFFQLYDGKFIVFNSNGPAKIFSSNWDFLKNVEIEYASPSDEEEAFSSISDAFVLNTSVDDLERSYIFVVQTVSHVIQVYVYENDDVAFLKTIGTIDTAGNGSSANLSSPEAVSAVLGITDEDSSYIKVFIANSGVASNTETSFIKSFIMGFDGDLSEPVELSYPKKNLAVSSEPGSLYFGESKNVKRIQALSVNQIAIINNQDEFGILDFSDENHTTLQMLKGSIKSLDNGDVIKAPVSFDISGSEIYIGDSSGHIASLINNLNDVDLYFGKNYIDLDNVVSEYVPQLQSVNSDNSDILTNLDDIVVLLETLISGLTGQDATDAGVILTAVEGTVTSLTEVTEDISSTITDLTEEATQFTPTFYNDQFGIIDFIKKIGDSIIFITRGKLYSANLPVISDQSYTFSIPALNFAYKVEGVIGFTGKVELSKDNINFYPLSDIPSKEISSDQRLYIKVSVSKEQLMLSEFLLEDGVLLISINE